MNKKDMCADLRTRAEIAECSLEGATEEVEALTRALKERPRLRPLYSGDPTRILLFEDPEQGIFSGTEAEVRAKLGVANGLVKAYYGLCTQYTEYLLVECGDMGDLKLVKSDTHKYQVVKTVPFPDEGEDE